MSGETKFDAEHIRDTWTVNGNDTVDVGFKDTNWRIRKFTLSKAELYLVVSVAVSTAKFMGLSVNEVVTTDTETDTRDAQIAALQAENATLRAEWDKAQAAYDNMRNWVIEESAEASGAMKLWRQEYQVNPRAAEKYEEFHARRGVLGEVWAALEHHFPMFFRDEMGDGADEVRGEW